MNKKAIFAKLKFQLPRLVINKWEKSNYIVALQVPLVKIEYLHSYLAFTILHLTSCANILKSLNYVC